MSLHPIPILSVKTLADVFVANERLYACGYRVGGFNKLADLHAHMTKEIENGTPIPHTILIEGQSIYYLRKDEKLMGIPMTHVNSLRHLVSYLSR